MLGRDELGHGEEPIEGGHDEDGAVRAHRRLGDGAALEVGELLVDGRGDGRGDGAARG